MLKCLVCGSVSLGTEYENPETHRHDNMDIVIRFPKRTYQSYHLPKEIYNAYMAAIKSRHIDYAICLLALRRTLESICKQQGQTSGTLVQMIQNLANAGILPNVLKEASTIIRKLGNVAARDNDREFSSDEVKHMIELTEAIIDYIYILPAKIDRLKNS